MTTSAMDTELRDLADRVHLEKNPRWGRVASSVITLPGHELAMAEISSWRGYSRTPLLSLDALAATAGVKSLWYKDEGQRFGLGSFKALGGGYAVFRVLQEAVHQKLGTCPSSEELRGPALRSMTLGITVTTATDGNHGRAVAWAASLLGCRCIVYIPRSCTAAREASIARFGAKVVRTIFGYDETVRLCAREASEHGFTVVSDTSWPGYVEVPREIMHGYTVLVEETLRQLPPREELTHVFVQGGVGGLAAAVCAHLSNRLAGGSPVIVVVEPEGAACLFASAQAGRPTRAKDPVGTLMAGLDCAEVSPIAWEVLNTGAMAFMTIPDDVAAPCMRLLANPSDATRPIVAGESGIAGLAGLLLVSGSSAHRNTLNLNQRSSVLVIGTEGATDQALYESLVSGRPARPEHSSEASPPPLE